MPLRFEKAGEDSRGNYVWCSSNNKKISIFEIKKGQARGGFFWEKEIHQYLISGKVEYRTKNIETKEEKIITIIPPSGMKLPPKTSDLIIALDDSLMVEIHENTKDGTLYHEYRKVVEQRIRSNF